MGTNKELQLLEQLFSELLKPENPNRLQRELSDLFVRINRQKGKVSLYGDEDELLASQTIFSWIEEGETKEGEAPKSSPLNPKITEALREVIARLEGKGFWDKPEFVRPFSVELVDESFTTLETLLFIDEELVQLSAPLLSGLDEELSDFLGKLLPELK